MSSATADHHREAAEYYEVSVRQKIQNIPSWPLSECDDSSLFIFYVEYFGGGGFGEDKSTLKCHPGLRDIVKSIYSNISCKITSRDVTIKI